MGGEGAQLTLPRPGVVEAPDELPAEVTPGGVVAGDLGPLVTRARADLGVTGHQEQRLHLDGLGTQTRRLDGGRAEHVSDNVWLENMKPAIGEGADAL